MRRLKRPWCSGDGGSGPQSPAGFYIKEGLGRASILCQDWYYRDNGGGEAGTAQFDHPLRPSASAS